MPTHLFVGEAARAKYQQHQRRRGLLPSSIQASSYVLGRFEVWHGDLLNASTEDIDTWLDSRYRTPKTRYCAISHLHNFYEWGVIEGLVEADPTLRVIRPRLRRYVPRPIHAQDLAHALEVAPPMMRAWLCLAAFMGLRCQEIAGLRVEDLLGDVVLIHMGKGHHERLIPANRHALNAISRLVLPVTGPVFQRDGRPFTPARVSHRMNDYLRGVGVSATAHQLRHYFASVVYAQTRDLRLVQELLGHASPTSTAIYTAWSPARAAEVVRDLSCSP